MYIVCLLWFLLLKEIILIDSATVVYVCLYVGQAVYVLCLWT